MNGVEVYLYLGATRPNQWVLLIHLFFQIDEIALDRAKLIDEVVSWITYWKT